MLLNDSKILALCKDKKMISPFLSKAERIHGVSGGPTPHGYDIRVGDKYQTPIGYKCINPASSRKLSHHDYEGGSIPKEGITINPGMILLLETMEVFDMPSTISATIFNKSTWQKLFIIVPNTIIDAGFNGTITLAIKNEGIWPVVIHKGMGIAHVVFHDSHEADTIYDGKYQNQKGVTGASFDDVVEKKEKK